MPRSEAVYGIAVGDVPPLLRECEALLRAAD
jgi:hypothetical protein